MNSNHFINVFVRFLIFVTFMASCLWCAHTAFETNSPGFGFLAFFLFCGSAGAAQAIVDITNKEK
jgi:hypothetical protein